MISHFRQLYQSLHEAETWLEAARQADEDKQLLDHAKSYSHAYWLAYQQALEAWWTWCEATRGVYWPLVALRQVYESGIVLLMPRDTVKLPIVTVKEKAA